MDPALIGVRLASNAVLPLVKKLFVAEGAGAGLVDKPIRISRLVSFRAALSGEKRTLVEADLRKLSAELVKQAVRAGERPVPPDEERAVADALAHTLHTLGDLDLSDVEAVQLGHEAFAASLRRASDRPDRHLSADATHLYARLLDTACLHILHFFTQRSTFVPRTLVEQSRRQGELVAKVDELIARTPRPDARDAEFERRYLAYIAKKHSKLTIYGLDLANSPGRWPLDAAYLSLEATAPGPLQKDLPQLLSSLSHRRQRFDQFLDAKLDGRDTGVFEFTADEVAQMLTEPRPADQALASHERVLLRGEAGSGKTTLVQWLAVSATRQDPDDPMAYVQGRVPFVLPLRTLTRHGERLPSPRDFLSAVGCPLAGTQPDGWEARVLASGRGLVLVDGIDEVPDAERARARMWLSDLIEAYPGNRWLVTSRPSAVREDWLADEDFAELTLTEMGRGAVTAFIQRWHQAARTGAADEDADLAAYESQLLEAVRAKSDLGRLATNPLMCGLICALHRDRRGFLPHGRKDLYTAALSMLLTRRDRERDMRVPDLREEPQIQLLQRLAYWLIRNGRTSMDRARAESIIRDTLPAVPEVAALGDTGAVYTHFLHRSGLLREPAPGTVDFIHRTFQDFLGARAAVEEGDFGVLVSHAADDQWEDVIRMAVAHARPRERAEIFSELLAQGDAAPDKRTRSRVYLLAAACLEHATDLAAPVREEVERRTSTLIPPRGLEDARDLAAIGPMVLDLLPGPEELPHHEDAHRVVITATDVRAEAAIPFLARFARHESVFVRRQLMWAWDRHECRPYAEQVIAHLDDGETHFTVVKDEQIAEITRLGLRPRQLDIRATVSAAAASELITACAPTLLRLSIPPGRLTPEARGAALRDLEALRLNEIAEPWSLAEFPAEAPLRDLGLFDARQTLTDVEHIGRWPQLEWVIFGRSDGPDSAADWQALARLPHLTQLHLSSGSLTHAPPGLSLPGITTLWLKHSGDWTTAAGHVSRLFPHVTDLRVDLLAATERIDVAPRHFPLRRLARVRVSGGQTDGLDALPDHVEVTLLP
ncbi:NACHT domain-containing protein [Streptomyces apocyni]|uniref:NACHT domain-containing protein n=1 Tax=Streptomyces apocyni TaxID=2654677 RepID=UPI0012EACE4F|nr:NACHT domain-containing protein [Streptomyces apocyni]